MIEEKPNPPVHSGLECFHCGKTGTMQLIKTGEGNVLICTKCLKNYDKN